MNRHNWNKTPFKIEVSKVTAAAAEILIGIWYGDRNLAIRHGLCSNVRARLRELGFSPSEERFIEDSMAHFFRKHGFADDYPVEGSVEGYLNSEDKYDPATSWGFKRLNLARQLAEYFASISKLPYANGRWL